MAPAADIRQNNRVHVALGAPAVGRYNSSRPVLDPDEDDVIIEHRPNLDVLADESGDLLQSVGPVEDLLDRHPLLAKSLRGEVGILGEIDAEADPEVLGFVRQVVDLLEELRFEVLLHRVVDQIRDELLCDLLLEEVVVAVAPCGAQLGEVVGVEQRHLALSFRGGWL